MAVGDCERRIGPITHLSLLRPDGHAISADRDDRDHVVALESYFRDPFDENKRPLSFCRIVFWMHGMNVCHSDPI